MDLITYSKAYNLLKQIFDSSIATQTKIDNPCRKPPFPYAQSALPTVSQSLKRATPETLGVSSSHIADFIDELLNDETLNIHNVMVIRKGFVLYELSCGAYDRNTWQLTHSECKTLTGIAIGLLVDRGLISVDDKIIKLLDTGRWNLAPITHKNITVEHLLTMTSGVAFNEAGSVTEEDWLKCFFESAVLEAGKNFNYNSMNSYVLSAIVRSVTGRSMSDFLTEFLFEPLGIENFFWETCPKGIEKGGWGLYIMPEDMAKIGLMLMNNGKWNGNRILSEEWIVAATKAHSEAPAYYGEYDYGYQMWVDRTYDCFLMNGMFSQNVFCFRENDMIILTNAGNNEMFQQSNLFKIVRKFFGGYKPVSHTIARRYGSSQRLNMIYKNNNGGIKEMSHTTKKGISYMCALLSGSEYTLTSPNACTSGLMPLLMQAIQNNYTKGLKSIFFAGGGMDDFHVTLYENDESYKISVGFTEPRYTDLLFHGEPYRVGTTGIFTTDEDDRRVLKLIISFVETSSTRIIKIFFSRNNDALTIRMSETPGREFLTDGIASIAAEVQDKPIAGAIVSKADSDILHYKIKSAFEPELTAIRSRK